MEGLDNTEYTIQVLTRDGSHPYVAATLCVDVMKVVKHLGTCNPSIANDIIQFLQPMQSDTSHNFVDGVVELLQGVNCEKIAVANGYKSDIFNVFRKRAYYQRIVAQAIVDARLKFLSAAPRLNVDGGKPRRKASHNKAANKKTKYAAKKPSNGLIKWVATARKAKVPSRNKKTGMRCLVEKTVYRNTATGELRVRKMAVSRTTGALRATYVAF